MNLLAPFSRTFQDFQKQECNYDPLQWMIDLGLSLWSYAEETSMYETNSREMIYWVGSRVGKNTTDDDVKQRDWGLTVTSNLLAIFISAALEAAVYFLHRISAWEDIYELADKTDYAT